jgi:hypothetical protein
MVRRLLLVLVACATSLSLVPTCASAQIVAPAAYFLEIDGQNVGQLDSFQGGSLIGSIVTQAQADNIVHKHLAGVKYEDISVTCGAGLTKPMYQWIKTSFDHSFSPKNGAIVGADLNGREVFRLQFYNGLITEVGLPALDASSKDAAKMSIKITPEYTRLVQPSGQPVQGALRTTQKHWLTSNFRIEIAGDSSLSSVNKVEAIVLKQKIVDSTLGQPRVLSDAGDLGLTQPMQDANPLLKWYLSFVVDGNNDTTQERRGSISYLATDGTELFRVDLNGLGIWLLRPDTQSISIDKFARVKAEMYCQTMTFSFD